jgi:hypothetical protein
MDTPLGRNGAALAAFGDIEAAFFGVDPFAANRDGVKLGESTFNPFLLIIETRYQLLLRLFDYYLGNA